MRWRDAPRIGIAGDAACKLFDAFWRRVDFTEEFDIDEQRVRFAFGPERAIDIHGVGEGRDTGFAEIDGDEAPDRPQLSKAWIGAIGGDGNSGFRAAAEDHAPEHAVARCLSVAAVVISSFRRCLQIFVKHVLSLPGRCRCLHKAVFFLSTGYRPPGFNKWCNACAFLLRWRAVRGNKVKKRCIFSAFCVDANPVSV